MSERPSVEYARQLMFRMTGDEKHAVAAESTFDVLWVLYTRVLRPVRSEVSGIDRFYLSKGHGPMAYYAVLAALGEVELTDVLQFGAFNGRLGHHPDGELVPGIHISSGSLGHGPGLAAGTALAWRSQGALRNRVFVLVGDGELDEGSTWEAIAAIGRLELSSIHVVVIDNGSASLGWPGGLMGRFVSEGWSSSEADSADHAAIERCLTRNSGRPSVTVIRHRSSRGDT